MDNHLNIEAERAAFEEFINEPVQSCNNWTRAKVYRPLEIESMWEVWQAARRTPVADGAALDLPKLPEAFGTMNSFDEEGYTTDWVLGFTAEQLQQYAREAISHYLRKQAGQGGEIKRWKDRLGGTDEYGREYQRDIDAANHEIADLRAMLKRVLAGQEGEQPTINKGEN